MNSSEDGDVPNEAMLEKGNLCNIQYLCASKGSTDVKSSLVLSILMIECEQQTITTLI